MAQLRQLIIVGFIFGAISGCGGAGGSTSNNIPTDPTGGGSNNNNNNNGVTRSLSVTVTNNNYTPGATTVSRGSTVQWTWNACTGDSYSGEECTQHTVTFDDGPGSQMQDKGTFSRTFNTAGTYTYHCAVHGTAMSGKVTVE